jgi:hypothetical protein
MVVIRRFRAACRSAVLVALVVLCGRLVTAAGAQQQLPPNGLGFYAEASSTRDFVDIETLRGSLRTVSVDLGSTLEARVPRRHRSMTAGRIWLYSQGGPFNLRTPRHAIGSALVLLRRGGLRVTYFPGHHRGALKISGLRTAHVQIVLTAAGASLIAPRICPGTEKFTVTATRTGASGVARTPSSTNC